MSEDTSYTKEVPPFFNRGVVIPIAVVAILLVALLGFAALQSGPASAVPIAACANTTVAYINTNLVPQGSSVQLVSVAESRGLYVLQVRYQSQDMTLYTTRDCSLLFTNTVNMAGSPGGQQPRATTQPPVKTSRPEADLYVMAFCPYGTQAETAMSPVYQLLGAKADIRIRYITTVSGTTAASVSSLHGPAEAAEDLRQSCINKIYPQKLWPYLDAFNKACYPSWQNDTVLASCRKDTLAALGMDSASIEACASGADGIGLLKTDESAANQYGVSGSPTLIINGVTYAGARTPEAFKQAVCSSFDTPPAECSTVLSSVSAASSGGCG